MSTELSQRGDRHFRPDPQGVLVPAEKCKVGRVLITVDPLIASTFAAQHSAWMLVNLLSRQFGVVVEIGLVVPEVDLLDGIAAFGGKNSLGKTLESCAQLIAGTNIRTSLNSNDASKFDVLVSVGGDAVCNLADRRLSIYADGWRWYVGDGNGMPSLPPTGVLSFGPYMAACFAAGEVFKHLRGMLPGKGAFIDESFGSLWSMTTGTSWESLEIGPDSKEIPNLDQFYFAGAGAVAQGAALALGSSRLKTAVIVIDDDSLDLTNGNRYVLATLEDANESKVQLIQKYLVACGVQCHAAQLKWDAYVAACGKMAPSFEVASRERDHKFAVVLSCVDKNLPRHEIQMSLPETLIGGSTDGLSAKVAMFCLHRDAACLKCYNKPEDRNQRIQQNLAEIAAYDSDQRSQWCQANDISEVDLRRLLAGPKCGELTEADLDRFGQASPDMSVGFVSAAAGVMLAAQLVRTNILGADAVADQGNAVVATFSTAGLRRRKVGRDQTCDCEGTLRPRWRRVWGR